MLPSWLLLRRLMTRWDTCDVHEADLSALICLPGLLSEVHSSWHILLVHKLHSRLHQVSILAEPNMPCSPGISLPMHPFMFHSG